MLLSSVQLDGAWELRTATLAGCLPDPKCPVHCIIHAPLFALEWAMRAGIKEKYRYRTLPTGASEQKKDMDPASASCAWCHQERLGLFGAVTADDARRAACTLVPAEA